MKLRICSMILILASLLAMTACGQTFASAPEAISTAALQALATGNETGYMSALTGDPQKDGEIWAHAEAQYQEFKKDQAAALAMPAREVKEIEQDPSEFTYSLTVRMWNQPSSWTIRTFQALKGFTPLENMEYTVYGGWKNEAMRQEATGHFYTKKLNGRWWYIDPLGYPYYCIGTTAMGYAYGNTGQEVAAITRYGSAEKWAIAAVREYKDELGFTSTTLWSEGHDALREVYDTVTYSVNLRIISTYENKLGAKDPTPSGSTLVLYGMHVFDPAFPAHCEGRVKVEAIEGRLNDPYFMGFFVDNEIPTGEGMLEEFLTLDVENMDINYYSYAAAWTFLAHETGKPDPTLADADDYGLKDLFRGFVYDRLYATVTPLVRQYAPNALLMGNRALSTQRSSEWLTRMVGYWCDVISHNWYHTVTPSADQLNQMTLWCDKPIMITEWYVDCEENEGNFPVSTSNIRPVTKTQADRGAQYQNYTLRLLECQNVVGWHWYRYIDRNDGAEGKQSNQGIYSSTHKLYGEFAEYVAQINRNAYALALYFDAR